MGLLVNVFIPETGKKTSLEYNDIQTIREWSHVQCKNTDSSEIHILTKGVLKREHIFLSEVLHILGCWKNIVIN